MSPIFARATGLPGIRVTPIDLLAPSCFWDYKSALEILHHRPGGAHNDGDKW
jgi:hypothetical protein